MINLFRTFALDDAGFLVSAELILVSTIAILSLVVGLTELSFAINNELDDVACAFGSINQSFCYAGQAGCKGKAVGSSFADRVDECDCNTISCNCSGPQPEASHKNHGHSWD